MTLGYFGLGKMGQGMVARLCEYGHEVFVYDENATLLEEAKQLGAKPCASPGELIRSLPDKKILWLMVPHTVVGDVLSAILQHLQAGDTIIDGGNSFFEESKKHFEYCHEKGVHFLDVGVSGGPHGARNGACMMIGGEREVHTNLEPLFKDLCQSGGYLYTGASGSGHFVKMVHNGIEYGMMQSIAEGFDVLTHSEYALDTKAVAHLFEHGSVIESKLISWLAKGFEAEGANLKGVSGVARASGEGQWTHEIAQNMNIQTPALDAALSVRKTSEENPSFQGKIITMLRNQFGGHAKE